MNRNHLLRLFVFFLALSLPLFCFADYKVVIKKNGKTVEGRLLSETDTAVTIVSGGAHITFQKADLDLDKMKELNANYSRPSDSKTMKPTNALSGSSKQEAEPSQLAKIAKDSKGKNEDSPQSMDSNAKAFQDYIASLEQQIKKGELTQDQQREVLQNLGSTKKGYSNYKAKSAKTLTKLEQTTMLEGLIKSLEFKLDNEIKAEGSDDKIAAIKKEIDQRKQELIQLQ